MMAASTEQVTTSDWRQTLPVLTGSMVTLRELRLSDAPSLLSDARDRRGGAIHLAAADDD